MKSFQSFKNVYIVAHTQFKNDYVTYISIKMKLLLI